MKWSEKQAAVFQDTESGEGNTVVVARAGCGKTTTILECLSRVPDGEDTLMVAFNKSIATEMGRRAKDTDATVSTLHSHGLKTVSKALGRVAVDKDRSLSLATEMLGRDRDTFRHRLRVCRVASLAKGTLASTLEEVDELLDAYDVDTGDSPREALVEHVVSLLRASEDDATQTIDFDDMVWLPHVLGLQPQRYDRVFVDETQDLNAAQLSLALKSVRKRGRLTCVGDDRQAIYGFRGADKEALGRIIKETGAKVLPLNITYRCPKAVVRIAQKIVPDFEAAPEAPEGTVKRGRAVDAGPGDFVLSRTNAPLVSLCLKFLRDGQKAEIQGRDIGRGLINFIKSSRAVDVDALRVHVDSWEMSEIRRLEEKGRDVSHVQDKALTLRTLSDGCPTVEAVVETLEKIFKDVKGDGSDQIILSSTHKAKGLERDRVFLLTDTYRPDDNTEEANIWYVAVTRAKDTLVLCEGT